MIRGRRRGVLVETVRIEKSNLRGSFPRQFYLPIYNQEYLRKNRFIVSMFSDLDSFSPDRVKAFRITQNENGTIISITTTLLMDEWIDELRRITIIQVQFLDVFGNELRNIDMDVAFGGYSLSCDYADDDLLQPTFTYKILE